MFDNYFNNDYFCNDYFNQKEDCIHEWEIIEFSSVFKDNEGNPLVKKKRCVTCKETIEFGVWYADVPKVVYMPPRIQFIPPPRLQFNLPPVFFNPHYQPIKQKI